MKLIIWSKFDKQINRPVGNLAPLLLSFTKMLMNRGEKATNVQIIKLEHRSIKRFVLWKLIY